jgi:ribosome biogenesis GTPase
MAQNVNLPINIIVNKIELAKNLEQVSRDFSIYKNIDYQVHFLSVKQENNLDSLKSCLRDKTHIFLGQSGVGKSSLINTLIPDLDLRVNEISTKTKLGRHTTTNTTIYHIPSGGDLIDSPGIREFQINEFSSKQILNGYREFKSYLGKCRFRNCQHVNEPDCAIRGALDSEVIHPARYQSYINLISE